MTTSAPLDRETVSSYKMTVIAKDQGEPSKSNEKSITINVEDVNDFTPEFESMDSIVLMPGMTKGTVLMTVKASDKDIGENGKLSYRIEVRDNYTCLIIVLNLFFIESKI